VEENKDFSDSDRARLQHIASEQEHQEWLKRRRRLMLGKIKNAALWVGAVGAAASYTWQAIERIMAWLKGH
jgi:hypothetical protein